MNNQQKKLEKEICIGVMTKNDEKSIERCLRSIPSNFKIFILDGGSTDKTVEIAKKNAINLNLIEYSDEKFGYDLVRNRKIILKEALNKNFRYVLFLDSDETLPELNYEINKFLSSNYDAGMIKHRNIVYGRLVRSVASSFHGRLITTQRDVLQGRIIESIAEDAKKYYFKNIKINHFINHKGAYFTVMKNIRWAQEALQSLEVNGRIESMNSRRASLRVRFGFYWPFIRFFYHYIFRLGFLEGYAGFVMATHAAMGEMVFQILKYESKLKNKNSSL